MIRNADYGPNGLTSARFCVDFSVKTVKLTVGREKRTICSLLKKLRHLRLDLRRYRQSHIGNAGRRDKDLRLSRNLLSSCLDHSGRRHAPQFAYDASGKIVGHTRNGASGLTFAYDENGRLSRAFQPNNPLEGATCTYDARRLASRTITHAAAPARRSATSMISAITSSPKPARTTRTA
jgi:YD repeat-containing protein